ncbi:phage tail protein [Pseudomonas sp. HMWF032]|uniref:DUF1353 domain-containing protein n=1 Tax=Pseudomonas sp. HMWF032 TaxID=2056866 RepID=UPI000D3BF6F1|nr:DUF1353 domain-containing protein [Pseudomonas sp. HMWF032]PTS86457.1 phage tail protein [Pseudomonas sp. HMWF032]PTT81354.1 phage tail protein [Pseudomonas sp. HMWF010]
MSGFTKPLIAEWVGPNLWETREPLPFYLGSLNAKTNVTVPYGFVTDGASIPRAFWPILSPWGEYAKAAVIHDYLCRYRRMTIAGQSVQISRLMCDLIFGACMEVLGVPQWKREVMFAAVRSYAITNGIK